MTEERIGPEDHEHETEERHDTTDTEPVYDSDLFPDTGETIGDSEDDYAMLDPDTGMGSPSTGEDGGRQPW